MKENKIIVAVTGASGAIYPKILLEKLKKIEQQISTVGVVFSKIAREVWEYELKNDDYKNLAYRVYDENDFYAPFASGSSGFNTMIICPCSMGTLGRIASGVSSDLISRAADVILKERQKLILVPREAPYSLIHIRNMELITLAGGIICPASPSFYSLPKTIEQAAETIVDRILDLAGLDVQTYRWVQNS